MTKETSNTITISSGIRFCSTNFFANAKVKHWQVKSTHKALSLKTQLTLSLIRFIIKATVHIAINFSHMIKSYCVQYEITQSCIAYSASYEIELLSIPYDFVLRLNCMWPNRDICSTFNSAANGMVCWPWRPLSVQQGQMFPTADCLPVHLHRNKDCTPIEISKQPCEPHCVLEVLSSNKCTCQAVKVYDWLASWLWYMYYV